MESEDVFSYYTKETSILKIEKFILIKFESSLKRLFQSSLIIYTVLNFQYSHRKKMLNNFLKNPVCLNCLKNCKYPPARFRINKKNICNTLVFRVWRRSDKAFLTQFNMRKKFSFSKTHQWWKFEADRQRIFFSCSIQWNIVSN